MPVPGECDLCALVRDSPERFDPTELRSFYEIDSPPLGRKVFVNVVVRDERGAETIVRQDYCPRCTQVHVLDDRGEKRWVPLWSVSRKKLHLGSLRTRSLDTEKLKAGRSALLPTDKEIAALERSKPA